jgi:hypothetical protein
MKKTVLAAALALLTLTPVLAQTQRIAGTIERMTESGMIVRPAAGGDNFDIVLADRLAVFDVSKAKLSDIKPGAFIGVGATPRPDGSQRAIQVTLLNESQRSSEGHRPWDRAPNGTMTNGTVDETVASVDGPVLTVKYKGGEKKIVVPADATILGYSVGDRSELKPGVRVAISGAKKRSDGKFEADRVNVGHGDVVPR